MSKAIVLNDKFEKSGELELPAKLDEISEQNLYLYAKAFLAGIRGANASAKTRSEVSGTGKKPFAQKGGGRARQGSLRAPTFVGGGVTFAPKSNRNYTQKVNKKQKRLALQYALNKKATEGALMVVDSLDITSGKTKDAAALAKKLAPRDGLFVVSALNEKNYLAFRNLSSHYLMEQNELNAYIVASYRVIVIEKAVLDSIVKEG
jgi:large subunit ribosomal protein L4